MKPSVVQLKTMDLGGNGGRPLHPIGKQFVADDGPCLLIAGESVSVVNEQVLDRSRLDQCQKTDKGWSVVEVVMETGLAPFVPQPEVEPKFRRFLDPKLPLVFE
jgi:hypothetical protein